MIESRKWMLGVDWPGIGRTIGVGPQAKKFNLYRLTVVNRVIVLLICAPTILRAQWQTNGVAVCDTSINHGFYMLPQLAADGQGGAFACWRDARKGNYDIYAQRINGDGRMLWQKNGIPIVSDSATQQFPRIIADGTGGAFIAWEDDRPGDTYVYAQRIDENGSPLWLPGGVRVAETPGLFISIASDSSGGLNLAWSHSTGISQSDVYVQRLNSLGRRVWADNGIQVTNRPGAITANDIAIATDNQGGAIVAWSEGPFNAERVYAQRIDKTGRPQWASNGIELSDGLRNIDVSLTPDLEGGGVVSWSNLSTNLKYAQRLDPNGQKMWGPSSIALGGIAAGGAQRQTSDGLGGAFVGHSRWIQHVDKLGNKLWLGDGGAYTTQQTGISNSTQVKGEGQGIYNFWTLEVSSGSLSDIYGQYIDSSGAPQWDPLGRPICSAASDQDWGRGVADGHGGAIIVWDDFRSGHSSVYAAKVDAGGVVTGIRDNPHTSDRELVLLEQNYPNPFNPATNFDFRIPNFGFVSLKVFDVLGREVATLVNEARAPGLYTVRWDGSGQPSGVYFYCLQAGKFVETKKLMLLR